MSKQVDLSNIRLTEVQTEEVDLYKKPPIKEIVFGGGIGFDSEQDLPAPPTSEVVTEATEPDLREEIEVRNAEYQKDCNFDISAVESLGIGNSTYLNKLTERIKERPAKISTGIEDLDYVTGGGWPTGISTVAASPNIGKTTILLQSAATMAMQGIAVVYITYDMRELDLTAKVISHTSYKLYKENGFTISDILNKNILNDSSDKSNAVIDEVARTQKHLFIRDLIYDPDFDNLCNSNEELKELNKIQRIFHVYSSIYKNLIFICDSLQQIAGFRNGSSGKESVDKQLQEFKGLSTYYEVPLILISTLNRSAYSKSSDIEITGLKESGNLEFDSDLVLILQPRFIKELDSKMTMDKFRELDYRDITIKCIKSRDSGYREKTMTLYAPGCTFIPFQGSEEQDEKVDRSKGKVENTRKPTWNKGYM